MFYFSSQYAKFLLNMLTVTALALSPMACKKAPSIGCAGSNAACPGGHVCKSDKCEQICEDDTSCPRGFHCGGEFCEPGASDIPSITAVNGAGTPACQSITSHNCIGAGLVVSGQNLMGGSFELQPDNGGIAIPLLASANSDSSMTLTPAGGSTDLPIGKFTLVVTNQAGSASTPIDLLKGEAGNDGLTVTGASVTSGRLIITLSDSSTIDAGVVGSGSGGISISSSTINNSGELVFTMSDNSTVNAGVLPSGGGSSGRLHQQTNATKSDTSYSQNRLVITLPVNAVSGPAVSAAIADDAALMDICGDVDGCNVSIGMTGLVWQDSPTSPTATLEIQAPRMGPVCKLFIKADSTDSTIRHWAVPEVCVNTYNGIDTSTGTVLYQPYNSAGFGIDNGLDSGTTTAVKHAWTVLDFRGACVLAESGANIGDNTTPGSGYLADTASGFHVMAAGSDWTAAAAITAEWKGQNRSCIFIFED